MEGVAGGSKVGPGRRISLFSTPFKRNPFKIALEIKDLK